MPGKVVLTVTRGPIMGRVFAFEGHDTFVFGRAEDCHARLPEGDPTASRHHFLIEVNAPESRLRDLGSMNGTFVNDVKHGGRAPGESPAEAAKRPAPEVDIRHGDVIGIGDTRIEVRVESPPGPAPAPAETVRRVLCQLCKDDVTAEVPGGRAGDYVCNSCRATLPGPALTVEVSGRRPEVPGAAPPPAVSSPVPGYELVKELGHGGMGVVHLARRASDGKLVALKLLLARVAVDEGMRRLFLREVEVASGLEHPHIVRILDRGAVGGVFFLAMELCEGGNLMSLAARSGGRLPVATAVRLVAQATRGLAHAHAKGVVHRDVKPENILLASAEDGARLADFGLAKSFEHAGLSGFTNTGDRAGTPLFMPREQLTSYKHAKPSSDVWSMGATLFALLTGQNAREFPKGKDPLAVILQGDVKPIRARDASIPERLASVVDRALAKEPRDRYPDGGALLEALERAL